MTPNDILRQLADADGLPRDALRAAAEQRAEMVPLFLAQIEEYLAAKAGQRAKKSRALFFIFHLLGDWREKSAYRPLARLLLSPSRELDLILGDGITSTSHRVMAAVCDGDPQPLFDIILDAKSDEHIRSRICEALAMLVLRAALPREEIARFLRDGFMNIEPQRQCFVWHGWQSAIAMVGLVELTPLVKKAFDRGFIDQQWMKFEHFEEDMKKAVQRAGARSCRGGTAFPNSTTLTRNVSVRPATSGSARDRPEAIPSEALAATIHAPAAVAGSSRSVVCGRGGLSRQVTWRSR